MCEELEKINNYTTIHRHDMKKAGSLSRKSSTMSFQSIRTVIISGMVFFSSPCLAFMPCISPFKRSSSPLSIHKSARIKSVRTMRRAMTSGGAKENGIDNFEGFGVGQKSLELRDLVEVNEGVNVSSEVESTNIQQKSEEFESPSNSQPAKAVPSLRPMAVLRFVAPTLALWIAPPIMSLIDTSAVGRFCGPTDLAALSPGCTLIDSSSYLFMFIATAATNMVVSSTANGEEEKISERIVSEALFLALLCGVGLATLVLLAGQPLLLAIAGKASASVVPSALQYATIRAFGQPFVVMASVARAAALARKDTRGPLVSVALASLLNFVGTTSLVRLTGLGIRGAAIGTLVADIAATTFLLTRIRTSRTKRQNKIIDEKLHSKQVPLLVLPSRESFFRFGSYAAPIFFTILGKSVVYNGVGATIGRMGSVALAAHQVLLQSFFFWTPVGDSVGMTSQVFLPAILAKEKAEGVPQRGAKRLLFVTGMVSGLVAAVLAALLPLKGAHLFTADLHVAAALRQTAPVLASCVAMHAIALTCEGMLLAQRDLKFLSQSYVITTIATAALLSSPYRPATLSGAWGLLALFQGVRALQFALRTFFISNKRKKSLQ